MFPSTCTVTGHQKTGHCAFLSVTGEFVPLIGNKMKTGKYWKRVPQTSDFILLFHTFLFSETEALLLTVCWRLIANLPRKCCNAVTQVTQLPEIQLRVSIKVKLASDTDKISPPRVRVTIRIKYFCKDTCNHLWTFLEIRKTAWSHVAQSSHS